MTNYIHMTVAHFDQIKKELLMKAHSRLKIIGAMKQKKSTFSKMTRHLKFQPFSFQVSI